VEHVKFAKEVPKAVIIQREEEQKITLQPPPARSAYIFYAPSMAKEIRSKDTSLPQSEAMKQAA
jgi:hypothetical protein